jgi:hypothetical protein
MEPHYIASFLIANRFGFGKYWNGIIFAKHPKAEYSLYVTDSKMAILSQGIDEDGERTIVADSDCFSTEELEAYFSIDYTKSSQINWFQPVNFVLFCENTKLTRNNIIYFMWPAVKMRFQESLTSPNTVIVYDKQTSPDLLHALQMKTSEAPFVGRVEFWSTLKLVDFCERMGNFAPKECQESTIKAYEKYFAKV